MRGHIKSASHVHGIPIDVKCERKGYVVGPYSVTDKGEYLPYVSMVDPESGMNWMPAQIPEMSEPICAFLIVNGYTDLTAQLPRPSSAWGTGIQLCGGRFSSDKNVDLSAIPEGSRNDELYRWCFGRFVNHPENRDQIIRDAFIRVCCSLLRAMPRRVNTRCLSRVTGSGDSLEDPLRALGRLHNSVSKAIT